MFNFQDENKKIMSQLCERNRSLIQLQEEKLKLEHTLKEEEKKHVFNAESLQANITKLQNEIDENKVR